VKANDPRNHTNQYEYEFVGGISWIVLVFFEGLASKRFNALAPQQKELTPVRNWSIYLPPCWTQSAGPQSLRPRTPSPRENKTILENLRND
jgi:hypothetical protein